MSKQSDYDKRQVSEGNVKVCLWIPVKKRKKLIEYANKLKGK